MEENFTPINFTPLQVEKIEKKAERHEIIMTFFLLLIIMTLLIIAVVLVFMIKRKLGF